jgi:hypothetical protein
MFIYLKANLFNDLFYVLKEILNLAICCYNILVMEFFFRVLHWATADGESGSSTVVFLKQLSHFGYKIGLRKAFWKWTPAWVNEFANKS